MSKCLRPHHGMCFQFYEGKGYSEDFTDHMGRIIKECEANPEQKLILKISADVVVHKKKILREKRCVKNV